MSRDETVVPLAEIERRILTVRGQKIMLDSDLAHLYGVPTKRLNEQVRRNLGRFPPEPRPKRIGFRVEEARPGYRRRRLRRTPPF